MPVFHVRDAQGGIIPLALVLNSDQSYSLAVAIDQDVTIPANVNIADGKDVVEGALADAASGPDAVGTVNSKLRQLTKVFPAAALSGVFPNTSAAPLVGAVMMADDGVNFVVIPLSTTTGDGVAKALKRVRVSSYGHVLNAAGTWDSIRGANADGQDVTGIAASGIMVWNPTTSKFDRVRTDGLGNLLASLATKIAGEDLVNDRLATNLKPVDSDSILETLQAAATATGNGTSINLRGYKSATVEVAGTFVGTVTFEVRIDTNWYSILMTKVTDGTTAATATAAGLFTMPAVNMALQDFRARISAYTSGAITVESRKHPR